MQVDAENRTLRNYLLETLPERDLEEIDLRIIEDEDFSHRLALAEEELVEDFLDNRLSADEVAAFQAHFLSSPARKQLITEIVSFRDLARSEARNTTESGTATEVQPAKKQSWFFRPMVLIPAFGVVILGGFLVWQFIAVGSLTPLEKEFATLNERELTDISSFPPNTTVNLVGGTLRDGGGTLKRKITDLSDPALIRIGLAPGEKTEKGFALQVVRGTNVIFRLNNLRSYQNANGNEVRVLLPRSIFSTGQFQIRLENRSTGTTTNYPLVIE